MSRESRLLKNTFILSIGTFLPQFASFITLPILTAFLSKEQYGTYDLITILVSLLLPVTTLQIHTAAFRFLIEHNNNRMLAKIYFSNILAFVLPVATMSLTILYFFLPVSSVALKLWICIYLFFDTIVTEVRQIARGLSKTMDYSISAIISAVVKMVVTFSLVRMLKYELMGAVIALALSPVLSLLYLFIRLRIYELVDFSLVSKKVLKEMLSYSWPMVPNNMSSWVMSASDRFVVTIFMGLAFNGVYGIANKIPHLLSLAQSTFAMAWQENASIFSKDEDVSNYYSKMFEIMTNFYAGCLSLVVAFAPLLFRMLIRGDYYDAYPHIPILIMAMFFSCMSTYLGGIYIAFKATKQVGITTILAALCNLIVNLALIKRIGLYAASGSTLISYIFLFLYRATDINRIIRIKYNVKKFIIAIITITFECTICYINSPYLNIINMWMGIALFAMLNKDIIYSVLRKVKCKTAKWH